MPDTSAPDAASEAPALWRPSVVAAWSVLFTPVRLSTTDAQLACAGPGACGPPGAALAARQHTCTVAGTAGRGHQRARQRQHAARAIDWAGWLGRRPAPCAARLAWHAGHGGGVQHRMLGGGIRVDEFVARVYPTPAGPALNRLRIRLGSDAAFSQNFRTSPSASSSDCCVRCRTILSGPSAYTIGYRETEIVC